MGILLCAPAITMQTRSSTIAYEQFIKVIIFHISLLRRFLSFANYIGCHHSAYCVHEGYFFY